MLCLQMLYLIMTMFVLFYTYYLKCGLLEQLHGPIARFVVKKKKTFIPVLYVHDDIALGAVIY